jgi:histidine triad (HIT) family protein
VIGPCVFCEIVAGERDQDVVYEDELVVAFLSQPQATWGHTLVVPRTHRSDIWEIEQDEAEAAIRAGRLIATVLRDEIGAEGVNLRQNNGGLAGQDVFHFHLHLMPRYEGDGLGRWCIWGEAPWTPPPGGEAKRRAVADAIRTGVAARIGSR